MQRDPFDGLAIRLQKGDQSAVAPFVADALGWLPQVYMRMGLASVDAEIRASVTIDGILEYKIWSYKQQPGKTFRAWVKTVAIREALDWHRSEDRIKPARDKFLSAERSRVEPNYQEWLQQVSEQDQPLLLEDAVEAMVDVHLAAADVRRKLDPIDRLILDLRHQETEDGNPITFPAIAEALRAEGHDLKPNSVQVRYNRRIAQLGTALMSDSRIPQRLKKEIKERKQ